MLYVIWDTQAKCVVGGTYRSRLRARRRADALDAAYGAVRYVVQVAVTSPHYR